MRSYVGVLLLLTACGGEAAPAAPEVTPEPVVETEPVVEETVVVDEPTAEAPSTPAAAEAPPPVELPEPANRYRIERGPWRSGGGALRTRLVRQTDLDDPTGRNVAWEEIEHPSPRATRLLREAAARAANAIVTGRYWENAPQCTITLGTSELVAFECVGRGLTRDLPGYLAESYGVAIAGDTVRPFTIGGAFAEPVDFAHLALARCEAERARLRQAFEAREPDGEYFEYEAGCDRDRDVGLSLVPEGVRVHYDYGDEDQEGRGMHPRHGIEVVVPWAELAAHMGPSSPLRSRLSTPPTHAEPPPNAWTAWPWEPVDEALVRWSTLPSAAREGLELFEGPMGFARLVTRTRARAPEGEPLVAAQTTPLALGRATHDLTLREVGSASAWARGFPLGVVPRGAVLAVAGPIGRIGQFPYAAAGPVLGFASSRNLAALGACLPEPPDGFDAASPLLRARVDLKRGGHTEGGALFAQTAARRTHVVLRSMSADCALGATRLDVTVPGALFDLRVANAAEESVVVLGTSGGTRYGVFTLGSREPALTVERHGEDPAGEDLVRIDEDGFPVTVDQGGAVRRYALVDGALAPQ